MAAANRYRRKMVSFRTELEGMIPTYGDLIAVSHDMPRWGESGEVVAYNPPLLTLSEPVAFVEGKTHSIVLRRRDGSLSGPWQAAPWGVSPGEDATQVLLEEEINFTPSTGSSEERTHFSFGVGEHWGALARVLAVQPRGEQIEITAVVENALVHAADCQRSP